MRYLAIAIIALCCGCASTQHNPLARINANDVEDIYIGSWTLDSDMFPFFPAPVLTRHEIYANVTPRLCTGPPIVSNLVALARSTAPWPEDEFIPISYVFLKAAFVSEDPTKWLGEVTIYGDGSLVHITDNPVKPRVDFTGHNRNLALALFRIVLEEDPDALRKWKTFLEKRKATELLNAYPFEELPDKKDTEQEPSDVPAEAAGR